VIVDQSGSGDIFSASKSGATKFTILNNGNIQLNNYIANNGLLYTNTTGVVQQLAAGSGNQCLEMNGAGNALDLDSLYRRQMKEALKQAGIDPDVFLKA